jgi:putative transposase
MMEAEFNHLNHATWECKYHVVFTPKYRKKLLFGKIKRHLGQVFHDLARRNECRIEEGHLMPDHVHMLISIPPKYSVAQIIGYMKGKSSIWIAQNVERNMRNFLGHKFWARGYCPVHRHAPAVRRGRCTNRLKAVVMNIMHCRTWSEISLVGPGG